MARNEAALAFGREVRRRRHAQRLTLDALGEAAGLTPHYVGSIEAGRRDPSISSMTKTAAGLSAPLPEMLGAPEVSAETSVEHGIIRRGSRVRARYIPENWPTWLVGCARAVPLVNSSGTGLRGVGQHGRKRRELDLETAHGNGHVGDRTPLYDHVTGGGEQYGLGELREQLVTFGG